MFVKYPHLERLGTDEVEGILEGKVYVFPKIDGTNASVWLNEDGTIGTGSRKRVVTVESDNQGFASHVQDRLNRHKFVCVFMQHPNWQLYGEWLVRHTLRTYRTTAWRKFYVFDVFDGERFLTLGEYALVLEDAGLDVIPVQTVVTNPTQEWLLKQLEANTYLINTGDGIGEGIVLKRYDFVNRYGRTTWAKVVRNEFKEQNKREFGASTVEMYNLEYDISQLLTEHVVQKVKAELEPWESKKIPQLLGRCWHAFITEEMWAILKKHKNPTINFKALQRYVTQRTKELSGVF